VRAISADTGPVRAEGRVIHRGGTVATSEADLRDGQGKLLAHGTSTCLIS
jgi:acyl-coenzyme A thioesterase PaaI-like protein